MRPAVRLSLAALACLASVSARAAAPRPDDAPLRSVQFVDRVEGWAVGDEGLVLHSIDGGKTWEPQSTGAALARASLRRVRMVTPYAGYAVGRIDGVYTHESRGVVLTTSDGGTWREATGQHLPGLSDAQFDGADGFAVGDATDLHPTGAFRTRDGGRTWDALRRPRCPVPTGWRAVDVHSPERALLVGGESPAVVRDQTITQPAALQAVGFGGVAVVRNGTETLIAGRDGEFARVNDDGRREPLTFPGATAGFRVGGLASVGREVWCVGRPGSVVWHSPDFGTTWTAYPTTITTGLNAVQMLDATTGWAVGDFGVILSTADGGKAWTTRRSGGQQAAVLQLHARPESIPLALTAKYALDGYHAVAVVTGPGDADRVNAAYRMAGGRVAETLRNKAGTADDTLRSKVLAIRTYRPIVVIGDDAAEACKLAADPATFPEQLATLGLKPHAVRAVRQCDSVAVDFASIEPAVGVALKDVTADATRLLTGTFATNPPACKCDDLIPGVPLAEGGPARAKAMHLNLPADVKARFEAAHKLRRELEALPATADAMPKRMKLLGELRDPRAALGEAERLEAAGQWTAAHAVYAWVATNFALQSEAVPAMRWLTRYRASGEQRRRIELGQQSMVTLASWEAVADGTPGQTGQKFKLPDAAAKLWDRAALEHEAALAAFGPAAFRDYGVQFPMLAARRKLGLNADAIETLRFFLAKSPADPRSDPRLCRVTEELRVLTGDGPDEPLIPRLIAHRAGTKPHLDGDLADACWTDAVAAPLPALPGYATKVRMLYDDEFLYVALECGHPVGKSLPKAEKRGHDDDIGGHDRVEILLDIDRDYATYYRLRVDQTGRAADDCCGDASWNPKWFIAVKPGERGWTAEIAVPLAELTGAPKLAGQTWCASVTRVIPADGPTATPDPGQMGHLRFAGEDTSRRGAK